MLKKTLYQVIRLTKNMRLEDGAEEFAKYLDKIGRADASIHDGVLS